MFSVNTMLVIWFCDISLSNLDIHSLSVIYFEHFTCGNICYLFIYLFTDIIYIIQL
jgi:uncharacterized PurR-regulated membrane protein YhhQ (DUF165 family)